MRLYWKIGLIAVGTVGTLLGAAGVMPHVVNMEVYKPAMIEAVRQATGRELVIDGPLKLRMFPVPGIGAGQVRFANAVGAKGAQMIDVRWVSIRPSWKALLAGRIEVGLLTLYRPTIVLETDADGRPNWDFSPTDQARGAPSKGLQMAIGRFAIVHGNVRYTDPKSQKTLVAENVEAEVKVGSFDGPFSVTGSATVNNVPLELAFTVGAPTDKGNTASLHVQVSSGKLDFAGNVSRIALDAAATGHLQIETGLLTDFVSDLVRATGGEPPVFGSSAIGRFAFDGGFEMSPARLAMDDFTMSMGHETAKGSLSLTPGTVPTIEGHVALASLNLEKWHAIATDPGLLGLIAANPAPAPATAKPAAPAAKPGAPAAKPVAAKAAPPVLNAKVTLDVGKVVYRKEAIRDVSITLDMQKGVLAVPNVRAILPGDMVLQAASDGPFSLTGPKLRETLEWFGLDTSGVPQDRLQTLRIAGQMKSTPNGVQLAGATFDLDDVHATGGGTFTLSLPIVSTLQVDVDRLDLDAYMPKLPALPGPSFFAVPTRTIDAATAAANPLAFGLRVKIAKLIVRRETLAGVEIDTNVQGNRLKVGTLKVANLLGARLGLQGTIDDYGTNPRFDLGFNASAPDADRLLDYFGLPKFANSKIGAATASGNVAGTMASLSLRDVSVDFLGASARASGKLALTQNVDFDFPNFALRSQELGRLTAALSGSRAAASVGPLSVAGSFKGNSQRAVFNGNIDALGVRMTGSVDGTLAARPKFVAVLKVPGTLDLDKLLGVSAQPVAASAESVAVPEGGQVPLSASRTASSKPFDLAALRSFDATLTLRTSAMSAASLKVDYADLDASLTRGVLKISRLTGQLYSGSVNFAGTVDASGAALEVDLKGDVKGIYVGQMLRDTAGSNSLGNSSLTVAVDGKIDATAIHVSGKGNSPATMRNGLTGGATLSGYLYPTVIKGSRSFASFATGLGSIFSEEMAFDSMMLKGFVDRQSKVAGRLVLQGGTVSTDNQTVQGQNATAYVTSRTSLPASTTDTSVRISSGSRQFVVTFKGPLSSPVVNTARAAD
ncbi:MAG: AsmA family protein [Alphaproteobacteria bacterium]|nr:AsmA family protein [Alphaproteobacteria bacterium]